VSPLIKLLSLRFGVALIGTICVLATGSRPVAADGCGNGLSPDRTIEGKANGWDFKIDASHECRGDVLARLQVSRRVPGEIAPRAGTDHPLIASGVFAVPIFCRRDDYMFLPPTALGGLPCADVPSNNHFDPHALALLVETQLPPPDLRIGMNPARGMVAVPTWFWVEGYDGGMLSQSETVVEADETCHLVVVRDSTGLAILDADGRPRTRRSCTIDTTTFVVDVRLWPSRFEWDFGDGHGRDLVCPDHGNCGDALGQPFVDSAHESPIRHPYQWSSLGVNGVQDAYTINLDITFGAQWRVSVNGPGGGWQSLPERKLSWSTPHQVQEAQAVLTRP
jgi:hypothetical protein